MSIPTEFFKQEISPQYLSNIHNIPLSEAEMLYVYSVRRTIRFKACYGTATNSIIFRMWQEEKLEAETQIKDLLKN